MENIKIFTRKDYEEMGSPSELEIPYGYIEIEDRVFYECKSLSTVTIPKSIKTIGNRAFYCTSLKTVTIPNSVTEIKEGAFQYCSCLTSVFLPDNLRKVESYTFYNCPLTSLVLPKNVEYIARTAFDLHYLTEFSIDCNNEHYKIIDGVLFTKDGTTLLGYTNVRTEKTYTTPLGVKKICSGSFFECKYLTSLIISEGVEEIGFNAIRLCKKLETIILPLSLLEISSQGIMDCESLQIITIPKNVKEIGRYVFSNSDSLCKIEVDSENKYYKSIDGVLFDKAGETLILYPSGGKCDYYIPEGVKKIGSYSFYERSKIVKLNIPNTVLNIGEMAFYCCKSLKEVLLPDALQTIGERAFESCDSLLHIKLPRNLTKYPNGVFDHCNNLTIEVDPNSQNFIVENNAVFNRDRTIFISYLETRGREHSYSVPNGVNVIEKNAFRDCHLDTIILPASLISIGEDPFRMCMVRNIVVKSINPPNLHHFMHIIGDATLYVPIGSRNLYQNSDWGLHFNVIEEKDLR